MKLRVIFNIMLMCVLLVTLASCQDTAPVVISSKPTLDVMSFNIRYGTANDGENSWATRKQMVFDVIADPKLDVVGLQEALAFQIDEIIEANPGYAHIGAGRDDGKDKGEFSCVLFRKDMYKAVESGTFWLSDTPDIVGSNTWGNACVRICSWARLVDNDGKGFYFYNLHLDHRNQKSREKSAVLVSKQIKNRTHPDEMFILTGDFNAAENNPIILYLKGKQPIDGAKNPVPMVDTFRQLHPEKKNAGTFSGFRGIKDSAKIDYVFVQPKTKTLNAEIVYTNIDGRYPSDHYPVTAEIIR